MKKNDYLNTNKWEEKKKEILHKFIGKKKRFIINIDTKTKNKTYEFLFVNKV